jgi:copper chaperone NosL
MPYVYAAFIVLTILSAAALFLGRRRLAFLFLAVGLFLVASVYIYIYAWLYSYTHTIIPGAPVKIEPFNPPYIGEYKIANFVIRSYPGPSIILMTSSAVAGIILAIRTRL